MAALDEIAGFLIEKESITGKEFMDIFNRVENADGDVTDNGIETTQI